jgi:CRISPR-associated protein Csm4
LFSEKNASWGFSLRGGYAYPYGSSTSYQKPQRLFIKEGSIFEKEPQGDLVKDEVNFDGLKSLYNYGIAYSVPIVINRSEN